MNAAPAPKRARGWLALALACCGACASEGALTQTIVLIDADSSVRRSAATLRLQLVGDEDAAVYGDTLRKPRWPVKMVIAPQRDDARRAFRLRAEARDSDGRTLVLAELQSGFVEGESRYARVVLTRRCDRTSAVIRESARRFGAALESAAEFTTCAPEMDPEEMTETREPPATIPDAGPDAAEGGNPPEPSRPRPPTVMTDDDGADAGADPTDPETCPQGMREDESGACTGPRDACETNNGGCEQRCVTLEEGRRCECDATSYLGSDGTTCQAWTAPQKIQTDAQDSGLYPRIAMSANGQAVAAWLQSDRVGSNDYRPGQGWQAQPLPGPPLNAGASAEGLSLAIDAKGRALAVWAERNTGESRWASEWNRDDGWSEPESIEADTPSFSSSPASLAINSKGVSLAAWGTTRDGAGTAWVRRLAANGAWSSPLAIGNIAVDAPSYDSIGIVLDAKDTGLAVFRGPASATMESVGVWASVISAQLTTSPAQRIDATDELRLPPENPRIAIDPQGRAVAIWSQETLFANRYEDGKWLGEIALQDRGLGPTWASDAHVTADAAGNFIVAWSESLEGDVSVWSRRFAREHSRWEPAERIDTDRPGLSMSPKVAAHGEGRFIVVWSRRIGTRSDIWANHYAPQSGWSGAIQLEKEDGGDASDPDVAVDASGHAIAVWSQQSAVHRQVWAARFE